MLVLQCCVCLSPSSMVAVCRLSVTLYIVAKRCVLEQRLGINMTVYRVGQKMAQFVLNTLTLSNINRFSKFFHCQNQEKIFNNIIVKDPTTPQVCRYTTL